MSENQAAYPIANRRIVGWSMATTLATQLVLDALNMALATRRPKCVIHHSDQGSQYTSIAFGHRCREAGTRPSMGSVGDAFDNAMCESFFATLEYELLDRNKFKTQAEARLAVFDFKDKPCGRPKRGPSLTAAARDGRTIVRAGREEWLRRGPNKRMETKRRTNCR